MLFFTTYDGAIEKGGLEGLGDAKRALDEARDSIQKLVVLEKMTRKECSDHGRVSGWNRYRLKLLRKLK